MSSKWIIIAFCTLLDSSQAIAQTFDPMTAVRVSVVSMQSILAAPPLPSLNSREGSDFSIQAGYLTGQASGTIAPGTGFDGSFSGGGLAVGLTGRATNSIGFFSMLAGNILNGGIDAYDPGQSNFPFVQNSSTQGLMATAGLNFRLLGENDSIFTLGLFGGPSIFYFQTSFQTALQNNPVYHYSAAPFFYGAVAGLQTEIHLAKALVAPYALYFADVSPSCRSFQTDAQATIVNPNCPGANAIQVPGSFTAYGLVLGYGAFRINIYSQVLNDSSMQGLTIQNYQVSYTF